MNCRICEPPACAWGGSVAMEAGGMGNSGTRFSGSSLAIASSGSLLNDGGSLFAKSDVVIDARSSFTNRSGLVSGDNISIRAASIVNDTLKSRDITANGFTDRGGGGRGSIFSI